MAFLQTLLTRIIRKLPDEVLYCVAWLMHFCMASIIGIFGFLTWNGEIKHLFTHVIQHGLQSEPIAFLLIGILALMTAQMLQFKGAYCYCQQLITVRRYQRGHVPFSM